METVNAWFTYIALEATQIKSFFKNYFICKWHLKRKKPKQLFRRWFFLAEEIFEKYVSHLNMTFSGSHPFAEIIPTASLKEWSTAASSTGGCYSTCLASPRHAGSTVVLLRSWGQSDWVKPPPVSCFSSSGRCSAGTQIKPCCEGRKYLPLLSLCPDNRVTSSTHSSPHFIVLPSPCFYFSQQVSFHWELARVV